MVRELKTIHEDQICDICARTILRGERPETYLAPGGLRKLVCELCAYRAESAGWIRESAAGDMPASLKRPEPRRSLVSRLKSRRRDGSAEPESEVEEVEEVVFEDVGEDLPEADARPRRVVRERPRRRKDPRHVRAIPTNTEVKVERALEFFNGSEHPRKIAGIQRSLGEPLVTAVPDPQSPSEVVIVVAWELSWYRYRVDLGDADESVMLVDKGLKLADIDMALREWNGTASADGHLSVATAASE